MIDLAAIFGMGDAAGAGAGIMPGESGGIPTAPAAPAAGATAFDQYMTDPRVQFGLNLLGASRERAPLLTALAAMHKSRQLKQQGDLQKAQLEQYKQHSALYGQQVATAERNRQQQQRALVGVSKYLKSQGIDFPGLGGEDEPTQLPPLNPGVQNLPMAPGAAATPQQMPMAPGGEGQPQAVAGGEQQPQQQPQAGMPQTPVQDIFRNRIILQESKGQHWASPGVPKISPKGAVGVAQVMPATGPEAAQLAGMPWDENRLRNDPSYNAKLGEAYFTKQMEDFGRPDYAAAAYNAGPGATARAIKVATDAKRPDMWLALLPKETQDYVKTVAAGTQPPAQQAPVQPPSGPLGLPGKGVPLAAAGAALEMAGVKGGKSLIELGKMMQPDNVPANSYQRDPRTGEMKYIPSPTEEQSLKLREREVQANERRTTVDEQKANLENAEKTQKINVEAGKATQAISNVNASMDRLEQTAKSLRDHPGLKMITGVTGGLINPRLLGEDARNAAALLDTLKAQVFVQGTTALRAASATGAGVGNQSDKEGDKLQGSMARLSQAQSLPEFKEALDEVINNATGTKQRMIGAYEQSFPGKKFTPPKTIKRTGTANGRKVVEYSDGTVSYAD